MSKYLVKMKIWGYYKTQIAADDVGNAKEAEETAFSEGDFGDMSDIDGELISMEKTEEGYDVCMKINGRYITEVEADSEKEAEEAAFDKGDFEDLYDIDGELVSAELIDGGPENESLERDYFTIFEEKGEKYLKYRGYSYRRETADEKEYAFCDVCFCTEKLKKILKEGIRDWIGRAAPECKQYIDECTEEEAADIAAGYFGGEPGERIDPDTIDMDTPCGNYWY